MPLPIQTPSQGHNLPDIVMAASSAIGVAGGFGAWVARRIGKKAEAHSQRVERVEERVGKLESRAQHLEDISMTRAEMTASIEHIATALTSVMQHTSDKMDNGFSDVRSDIRAVHERLDDHIDKGVGHA